MNKRYFEPQNLPSYILLAALSLVFIFQNFDLDFPQRSDDNIYIILARNFANGEGYRDPTYPGSQNLITVPSAFALFLSICFHFPQSMLLVKILIVSALISGVLLIYRFLRKLVPYKEALLVSAAFSTAPFFTLLGNSVLSETLFIPVLYFALNKFTKNIKETNKLNVSWTELICWIILSRIRLIGIAFLGSFLLILFKRKKWKKILVTALLLLLWIFWERSNYIPSPDKQPGGYIEILSSIYSFEQNPYHALMEIIDDYRHNIRSFATSMNANILFPYFYSLFPMNKIKLLIVIAVFLNSFWGMFLLWKKNILIRPVLYAFLIACIPIFSWSRTGTIFRYLFPFFPLLALFFLYPFVQLKASSTKNYTSFLSFTFALIIVFNQILHSLNLESYDSHIIEKGNFAKIHSFISESASKPDIVLSPQYQYSYLKTQIKTFRFRIPEDLCVNKSFLRDKKVWAITNKSKNVNISTHLCDSTKINFIYPPLLTSGQWNLFKVIIH